MSRFNGSILSFEIFGASHAAEIGICAEGLPAGESVDIEALRVFLKRRAPGSSELTTPRKEADEPVFLSGLSGGCTNGEPLRAVIKNTNVRSSDYANIRHLPRPGHADFCAWVKYGLDFDMSGGGPFSGRLTAPMCILGGICLQILGRRGIRISSRAVSIGGKTEALSDEILRAKADGDSVGGVIECRIDGFPAGYGGELFDGMEGLISRLIFAIPAVKGIEFGAGFAATKLRGSENNDPFIVKDGHVLTEGNNHGGILGGISTGMPIIFRVAIKPTPSIAKPQRSVDLDTMEPAELTIKGRHDPCIVPRALPVVEAAAAIAALDLICGEKPKEEL